MKKLFFLITMVCLSVFLVACGKTSRVVVYDQADLGLASVQDYNNLKTLIARSRQKNEGIFNWFREGFGNFDSTNAVPESQVDAGEDQAESHSKTNVQVEGVDEGDIIKTDGNRIYRIRYNSLQVIQLLGNGMMEVVLNEEMDSTNYDTRYTYYSDLYLTENYLVVIGQRYTYFRLFMGDTEIPQGEFEDEKIMPDWYWYGVPQTVISVYDLDSLLVVETFELSGYLSTTRLIDNNLYVISNQYVIIDDVTDPRPLFKKGDELIIPRYDEIKFLEDQTLSSYTIIVQIGLNSEVTLDYDIFLGSVSWGQTYVSKNAIYLATYEYFYSTLEREYRVKGLLVSYMFNPDGSVVYGGAGEFKGYVINQFAMDEYNNTFRIVTTDGWGDTTKNRLYVFERKLIDGKRVLSQVALIDEGLGKPRERVQSARFNKNIATVVTFEMTDPFYTIDLTDPKNPIIRAGLEVTGFSTYQHPWGDDYVLGIGYETDSQGVIIGLKLSLYDITDLDDPVEVGSPLVLLNGQNGWTYSEALHNHKALLVGEELGIIGFAIGKYIWTSYDYNYINEYLIFRINPESNTPISIETSIGHFDIYQSYRSEYAQKGIYLYDSGVERAVYVNGYLYVVSGAAITSHNMNDAYKRIQAIKFF
jgi:inhibitor of cysteine peptidase